MWFHSGDGSAGQPPPAASAAPGWYPGGRFHSEGDEAPSPGELYIFSVLHQLCMVKPSLLTAKEGKQPGNLAVWYAKLLADDAVARVLNGEAAIGKLNQYFMSA